MTGRPLSSATQLHPQDPAVSEGPGESLRHGDPLVPGHNSDAIKVGCAGMDKVYTAKLNSLNNLL